MSNSNRIRVSPEQFSKAVGQLIERFGDEAYEIAEKASKSAARQTTSKLKGSAPTGGQYARGWSHKAQKNGVTKYSETVYNRTDYQLTHLLEKPHATGGGGHYPKKANYTGTIAKIEAEQTERFMEEVISKL